MTAPDARRQRGGSARDSSPPTCCLRTVLVKGVAAGKGFAPRKFKLSLDRSGTELEDIIDAVQARKEVNPQIWTTQPHYTGYVPGEFNTAFRYELTDKTGKSVAQRRTGRPGHLPALHARIRARRSKASSTPTIW